MKVVLTHNWISETSRFPQTRLWEFLFWVKQGDYKLVASLVAQSVKNLPATQETQFRFLGRGDPLEKEMATHFSIPAWRIPWTQEPGKLQSMVNHYHKLPPPSLPPLHFWEYLFQNWTPCLPNLYLLGRCLSAHLKENLPLEIWCQSVSI